MVHYMVYGAWYMAQGTQTEAERLAISAAPNNRLTLLQAPMQGSE